MRVVVIWEPLQVLRAAGVSDEEALSRVRLALAEDLGSGDITTAALVPPGLLGKARIFAGEACTLCGLPVAALCFRERGASLSPLREEGEEVAAGDAVARVEGPVRGILEAERVALNFLGRLSGVATLARAFVRAAGGRAQVRDTRKTTPGLRALEKYAVGVGGARPHRKDLSSAFLIKENHIRAVGGVAEAVKRARAAGAGRSLEVEVEDLAGLEEALAAGAELVLLDNMDPEGVARAVSAAAGRVELEASGGISLENVAAFASTGVSYLAVGRITRLAAILDFSLELEEVAGEGG